MSAASIAFANFSVVLPQGRLFFIPELAMEEGISTAIIGRTGVGKSVLLRAAAGILPVSPFVISGNATVLGKCVYRGGRKASFELWRGLRERGLLFVPPEPAQVLNHALTLSQNLKVFAEDGAARVEETLDAYFDIRWKDFERRYPDEISGGELQRISLMILLARKGHLVLLDEPTVSLDADLRIRFVDFFNRELLTSRQGDGYSRTILLASHDLDFVERVAVQRCLKLEGGRLYEVDPGEESPAPRQDGSKGAGSISLDIRGLSQSYATKGVFGSRRKSVIKGFSAEFRTSRVYGVLGPSGCGKTSLFKAALRLVSDTEGEILFTGTDLVRLKPDERGTDPRDFRGLRRRLGIVLQDSRFSFLPDRSVSSSLRLIFGKAGIDPESGLDMARSLLGELRLEDRHLSALPLSLSSGEAKRMDLLRVLACDFDLLLLDEPFAHIDFETRRAVMDAVKKWLRSRVRALVVVTHEDFDLRTFTDEMLDFSELNSRG